MHLILAIFMLVSLASAQTPFEFAVVQELVGGEPFISIIRIKLNSGVPESGRTQLELTTRAGMMMEGSHAVYPDSSTSNHVVFSGIVEYKAQIPVFTINRIFSVIADCMNRFPGMGITDLALDVVDTSDLSWISIKCGITSIDSVLSGTLSHEVFWRNAELREFEVGTAGFPTQMRRPLIPQWSIAADIIPIDTEDADTERSTQPWKSLLLPGWGQLSAGRGIGWLNILVEAGGIALLAAGEDDTGIAVLGANHFISFIDLF
ncbi:MAG: hypothetical protein GQ565_04610 [Candidatus Aegiribacteria sp.]|nr:hypothetical protein [Candidatus Aegiribacteria sp.]